MPCTQDYETERTYIETVTLREAIPANKMDFTTLGMIMQTIGIFYNTLRVEAAEEMAWRLAKFELQSGQYARVFAIWLRTPRPHGK